MPADSHQEVVGFDITVNEVLVVHVFYAAGHLWEQKQLLYIHTDSTRGGNVRTPPVVRRERGNLKVTGPSVCFFPNANRKRRKERDRDREGEEKGSGMLSVITERRSTQVEHQL